MFPIRSTTAAALLLPFLLNVAAADRKARPKPRPRVVNPANALEKVNDASDVTTLSPGSSGVRVIRAQILIDRARFSPGEIDGRFGADLEIAVKGYQERHKLKPSGLVDKEVWELLNADTEDLLTYYTITAQDLREPLITIPKDVLEQAKLKRMGYQSSDERMAEKFHLSPKLLAELNPNKKFDEPGEEILVPSLHRERAARAAKVVVSKSKRTVTALALNGEILAQYPATIGGPHDPLPIGSWKITVVRPYPVFYYNPERFWNAKQDAPKAQLPPGPNNPAGTVWIGLSKPHYGIHGSPEPGTVRRNESYGCIRLTNWDAWDLSQMVRVGTPAILEE
jgi:lipoprotein-anchoring transpeptidase ErfK/SrfK